MGSAGIKVIVVGVDGSQNSRAALDWAAGEAAFRGCDLRAVLVWTPPAPGVGVTAKSLRVPDTGSYQASAQAALEQVVAEELGPDHRVTCAALRGQPVRVLISEGRHAEVLVVGARGSGGFRGLRLGSVSEQVVRHAPCPTLVVPAVRRGG